MRVLNPTNPFNPADARSRQLFKGGGSVPVATPAPPPVTERTTEVRQAKRDASRILRKRSAFLQSTKLAGETGGGTKGYSSSALLG